MKHYEQSAEDKAWVAQQMALAAEEMAARAKKMAERPKAPCAYCGELVYATDEWTQAPSADEVNVHLEDGRHFHTDCYGVYLIGKHQS